MSSKPTIGSLIKDEVDDQHIPITKFAKMINCERNNVYNIFKRNTIDIQLLQRISIVLKHNFFEDLAKDLDLARPVQVDEKELERLRAINQFLEAVPKAFERQNIDVAIVSGTKHGKEKEIPTPDFFLSRFNITFTIGQTYEEKCNGFWEGNVIFQKCNTKDDNGRYRVPDDILVIGASAFQECGHLNEVFLPEGLEVIKIEYLPRTWYYLKSLNDENNGGH